VFVKKKKKNPTEALDLARLQVLCLTCSKFIWFLVDKGFLRLCATNLILFDLFWLYLLNEILLLPACTLVQHGLEASFIAFLCLYIYAFPLLLRVLVNLSFFIIYFLNFLSLGLSFESQLKMKVNLPLSSLHSC
jgi:hypothetical protein